MPKVNPPKKIIKVNSSTFGIDASAYPKTTANAEKELTKAIRKVLFCSHVEPL
ncbi:MAG: hypothetical protein ACFE75_13720 [Candidatus Hodarchaeota archaeon]